MQYSIWLVPPEPIYSQLKQIIDKLAVEYDSHKFEPHMTLLGNIDKELSEIEPNTKQLAKLGELELSLSHVSFSTTYFQSVFVRVNSTARLMQLNLDAKNLFGMENTVFMPHISLLYGDHHMAVREKAALKVEIKPSAFVVKDIVIIPVTPDPSRWKHALKIPFD